MPALKLPATLARNPDLGDAERKYLLYALGKAADLGVTVKLSRARMVRCGGFLSSGYFTDVPEPVLAVATGKPTDEWFSTFIHEACHMEQWAEGSDAWTSLTVDGVDACSLIDGWLSGDAVDDGVIADAVKRVKAMEADCERRVLRKVKAFALPIAPALYSQRANAYIHFYDWMLENRKWYPASSPPYGTDGIVVAAPSRIADSAPRTLRKAYYAHYGTA